MRVRYGDVLAKQQRTDPCGQLFTSLLSYNALSLCFFFLLGRVSYELVRTTEKKKKR